MRVEGSGRRVQGSGFRVEVQGTVVKVAEPDQMFPSANQLSLFSLYLV